ncbi:hypothetical protein EI613_11795 [Azospirillum sp. 412522]|nr:hypothetical protein [Azospirillum sp. 412522]MBY6262590.1 hypothetical protein [Azospirillum sp. 412522]
MLRILLALALALFAGPLAMGASEARAEPQKVIVGSYINQITGLNLREKQVTVDFYVWFRWDADDINPLDTFEVMNGTISSKEPTPLRKIKDQNYVSARVHAVLNQAWDVSRFPLDKQSIRIEIEDNDRTIEKLVYVADTENTEINPDVDIPGYNVTKSSAAIMEKAYHTNYGDISLPKAHESRFSRFVQEVQIDRPNTIYYFKTFSTIFISCLVAFLAFLVKPIDLDPRFGLGIGALFAVVASYFIVAGELPHSTGFTLSDKINMASMGLIFLSLLQSSVSLMIYERDAAKAIKLDHISVVVFPVVYALVCVWLTVA